MTMDGLKRCRIKLTRCKRSDPRYVLMRDRHYIPNKGCHGQQMHYLVMLDDVHVGIISGASAVWAVASRDIFFGITKENRKAALPSVINNVVFRLEVHQKNLGTQVLSLWRKTIAIDWEARYGVRVHGFETFVIEEPHRKGAMYKADNWAFLGKTAGRTKVHSKALGLKDKAEWVDTDKKLIFAKKIVGTELSIVYHSAWRRDVLSRKLPPLIYGAQKNIYPTDYTRRHVDIPESDDGPL